MAPLDLSALLPAASVPGPQAGLQVASGVPAGAAIAAVYAAAGGVTCLILGGRPGYGLVAGVVGGLGAAKITGSDLAGTAGAIGLAALAAYRYPRRRYG